MGGWKAFCGCGVLVLLGGLACVGPTLGQQPPAKSDTKSPAADSDRAPAANGLSEAERISRLQRSIDADQERLDQLKSAIENPAGEYARADEAFKTLDQELADVKRELAAAQNAGRVLDVDVLRASLAELEPRWVEARTQFQLAIEERKAQQDGIATLETKLLRDREALDRLRGNTAKTPAEAAPAATAPASAESRGPESSPPSPAASPSEPNGQPSGVPNPLLGGSPLGGIPAAGPSSPAPANSRAEAPEKLRPEVVEAQATVAARTEDALAAEEELAAIEERLRRLDENIANQRRLQTVAQEKVDAGQEAIDTLNAELEARLVGGESIAEATRQLTAAQNGLLAAREEVQRQAIYVEELQHQRDVLLGEQATATRDLENKQQVVEKASSELKALTSPWSPTNILAWMSDEGLKIVIILVVIASVLWLSRLVENRLVLLLTTTSRRGGRDERENRARTLVTVGLNTLRTVIVFVGSAMILDQLGVPIGPILGGAAVVGLAVAFGAQSLIKDYFTGFMVLMEQQYMIGDVVRIGGVDGQVEAISLRMTVLRDLEGRVHFIPHGQITTVTNLTHGWSRAVFDLHVAYKEDADRVMSVVMELCQEMKQDPTFGLMILDEPQMFGVDAFGESAIVVKFALKTRPLRQWEIKREMLRRIKRRFDELGIEIPFPHRTLYLRSDGGSGSAEQLLAERFAISGHRPNHD